MSVPPALGAAASILACPHCGSALAPSAGTLACARGHRFDVAREGHVTLAAPRRRPAAGDTAEMVAARDRILGAGHFAPLSAALAAAVPADARAIVDAGAGTGQHLARVLDGRADDTVAVALDSSRAALRRASRADPRIAAVVCDVWGPLPLRTAVADAVLDVFAPRNGDEFARVLRPGGVLVVATPAPAHLQELREPFGMLAVDPRKAERLAGHLPASLQPASAETVAYGLALTPADAAALVRMGPSAHHQTPDETARRAAALAARTPVTVAVRVETFLQMGR